MILANLCLLFLCSWTTDVPWLCEALTYEDFTDTGVGCLDDCFEPAIQDEAQTVVSQERN